MKLFVSPFACSMAPHIVLNELGMKFDLEKVDMHTKKSATGDYMALNHKGYVPALMLDNGELLTEGVAIMQYLADQKPEAKLIPKAGTWERYRAIEWLNYISTELHKGFSPLFYVDKILKDKEAQTQMRTFVTEGLHKRIQFVSDELKNKKFVMGDQFTVCDAYLFTIMGWTKWVKVDLTQWPTMMGYVERVQTRPAVAKTMAEEAKFEKH